MRITNENITELNSNQIFVFGSNLSGIHGGGAARTALQWGAIWGQAVGLQGATYAIPTKDAEIMYALPPVEIKPYVDEFIEFAKNHPELEFLVTEIGCGLAGLTHEEVAPLFINAIDIDNIYLPAKFLAIFRKQAIEWLNTYEGVDKLKITSKYYSDKIPQNLTDEEIENIWHHEIKNIEDWWSSNHPKSRYEMVQHVYPQFTGPITFNMISKIYKLFYTK